MKTKKLSYFKLFFSNLIILSACNPLPISPLKDKESVRVSGQIFTTTGAPFQGTVQVITARESYAPQTQSDGRFSLELLGFETKGLLDQASRIRFSATAPDGSTVSQSKTLLKSEEQLPFMRFWNDLSAPLNDALLTADPEFRWNKAPLAPTKYRVTVSHARLGTFWQAESLTDTAGPLPLALLDNQSEYNWSVTALYPDYQAQSSLRTFRTGQLHRHIPIQSAQVDGQNRPAFFDAFYQAELKDSLDLSPHAPIDIVLDLGTVQSVSSVILASNGFPANLKLFAGETPEKTGMPLIQETIQDYQLMTFPEAVKARYIVLELSGKSGFRSVQEIRVLAPSPQK